MPNEVRRNDCGVNITEGVLLHSKVFVENGLL
jgi:hypothetical protein